MFVAIQVTGQDYFPWPVTPFNSSQPITGTFGEYRSTSSSGHFHNGTDIPKADGSPVYPVKNGKVTSIGTTATEGSNAYIRIADIAYVHIDPNPALSIGDDVIASETVLGTIINGMGHVHMTDGYVGGERNSISPFRGLSPYIDTWSPRLRYVNFYVNNTTTRISSDNLAGLVDIIVKVEEANGPPGSSSAVLNNGTYKIGYKIFSADTSTVVFEPPDEGLRFQFDSKPSNSCVNITYFRPLSSTSSHVYQVTNNYCGDNYWDTRFLDPGPYVVMIFTEDTRQNTDTLYVPVNIEESDIIAPAQPVFRHLRGTDQDMRLSWFPNNDDDLMGYRLYFSFDNENWSLFRDESELTSTTTDTILNQVLNTDVYFRLTAVDDAPVTNESDLSDVYGLSNGPEFREKVLVVDGFDRTSGGWPSPYHTFIYTHGNAIVRNQVSFDSAPNEAVGDSTINLDDYAAVFWILGDESTSDETFSKTEQALVKAYLENGGYLFVSGSDIATDLDADAYGSADAEDEQFLNDYLKADFLNRITDASTATGNGIFSGIDPNFGQGIYLTDGHDIISLNGEQVMPVFEYATDQYMGLLYEGTFGSGSVPGKLVCLTFPFETISAVEDRIALFDRVLDYFFGPSSITPDKTGFSKAPEHFVFLPAYPNPFNPKVQFSYQLPAASNVQVHIFNILGRKIRSLLRESQGPGHHSLQWDGTSDSYETVPSGIYLVRLTAQRRDGKGQFSATKKVIFSK